MPFISRVISTNRRCQFELQPIRIQCARMRGWSSFIRLCTVSSPLACSCVPPATRTLTGGTATTGSAGGVSSARDEPHPSTARIPWVTRRSILPP